MLVASLFDTSLQHRYFHAAKSIQKYISSLGVMTLGMPHYILFCDLQGEFLSSVTFTGIDGCQGCLDARGVMCHT